MYRSITKRDLIDYLAGIGDREIREQIAREAQITGSEVQKWVQQMDAKLADPFNVDWAQVASAPETEPDEENIQSNQELTGGDAVAKELETVDEIVAATSTLVAIAAGLLVGWFHGWKAGLMTSLGTPLCVCVFWGIPRGIYVIRKNGSKLEDIRPFVLFNLLLFSVILGLLLGWSFGWLTGILTSLVALPLGLLVWFMIDFVIISITDIQREDLQSGNSVDQVDSSFVRRPHFTGWRQRFFYEVTSIWAGLFVFVFTEFAKERRDFQRGIKAAKIACLLSYGNDLKLIKSMVSLGEFYCLAGQYDVAQRQLRRSLEFARRKYTEDGNAFREVLATCLNCLGTTCEYMNDYDNARQYLAESLDIRKASAAQNDFELAANLNGLGLAHSYTGDHERAVELYKEAERYARKEVGDDHLLTGVILSNLSKTYQLMGREVQARTTHEQGSKILTKRLSPHHRAFTTSGTNVSVAIKTRPLIRCQLHDVALSV